MNRDSDGQTDLAGVRQWRTSDFTYHLPPERVAQYPLRSRDDSRLLVIHRSTFQHKRFHELPQILPPKSLLILNNTRVIPAQFSGRKAATGGKVKILLLNRETDNLWTALAKGKLHKGIRLELAEGALSALVEEVLDEGKVRIRFSENSNLDERIEREGITPLPPYIHREIPAKYDRERYQTVFAEVKGAVAAPTAGLHFTRTLLKRLKAAGSEIAFLTLHVGSGTFSPVRCQRLCDHKMEAEFFILPQETVLSVHRAKEEGRCVIAVGSTVTRVLESMVNKEGNLTAGEGWTDLFIIPGYRFRIPDALITNFHLPRSTLLALTCAFGGYKRIMQAYRIAVEENYRFYSYGDASLIFNPNYPGYFPVSRDLM